MIAIVSLTPILLNMKIEAPSTTQKEVISLIQKKTTNYPKDRMTANLGAEVS